MSTSRPLGEQLSTVDVVYVVLRSAEGPLTFEQIFERVNALQPVRTRAPKATVRGALSQSAQIISLGDGRYGYLPRLLHGSVVRWPLDGATPVDGPLAYPADVRHALFPDFFENNKRKLNRPASLRLPSGEVASIELEHLGDSTWGMSALPESLRQYLLAHRASVSDDLLIRVVDAESGTYDVWLERGAQRDELALERRGRELADATYGFLRSSRSFDVPVWEILDALLARGAYRADVPPHPLAEVLSRDSRFLDTGDGHGWMLVEKSGPMPTPRRPLAIALGRDVLDLIPPGADRRASAATLLDAVLPEAGPRRGNTVGRRRSGTPRIYQLKVTLKGIRPPIWRRLLVRSDTPLDGLHEVLQASMGWFGLHLHAFEVDGVEYGEADVELFNPLEDEKDVTLAQVAPVVGARMMYRYDFGDDWAHELLVEKVVAPEPGGIYPRCIAGKRACPPEDVGGPPGYAQFLEMLSDRQHPGHTAMRKWAGGDFDPGAFDLDAINAALRLVVAPSAR